MYVVEVLAIGVQVVNGETELSHLKINPVLPLKVNNPVVDPEQIVVPPVTLPPTEGGLTVTMVSVELAEGQTPFCTTARNFVLCVKGSDMYVVELLAIVVHVVNGEIELSHLVTKPEPILPVNLSIPLVAPEQIVVPPVAFPPKEGCVTIIEMVLETAFGLTPAHVPFETSVHDI